MTRGEYTLKRAEIDKRIRCLTDERDALDREYVQTLTDIRVGDKIEYGDNTRRVGVVKSIYLLGGGTAAFSVARIKKDGSVSDYLTEVWEYHNPQKVDK